MIADREYAGLLAACLAGERVTTRNSECLRAIGVQLWFDRTPLVCLRRTPWKLALREMQWFLSGSNNINDLHPSVHHWWRPWADAQGNIPNNYGSQFRYFAGRRSTLDQIDHMVRGVREHPFSRRNVLTTWNSADMVHELTPITNCHGTLLSAHVDLDGRLTLCMVQRSADVVVGLPANWLQYWALLLWLAARTGRGVGRLMWTGLDCHVYAAHEGIAREMVGLARDGHAAGGPELTYSPASDEFLADDFALSGEYRPLLERKVEMVV